MKRTLLMVMALAVLLTQCRKPEVKFPSPVVPEGTTVSMTVTAGPGSKTDITTAGGITWSEGDKLYVGFGGEYVGYLTLTSGQNTPTGWFSGNVTLPTSTENGEKTFHFFYLGSNPPEVASSAKSVDVSFAEQEIHADANHKLVNASKHHVGYGSAKGTVAGNEVTGINVTLVSKVALARFSFKKNGTSEGYSGALTLSGDHIYNSMTVGFGGTFTGEKTDGGKINLTNTTSSEKYVMLVPADATAATLKFDAGAGTTDCNLANGIEANKYYGQGGAIEVMVKVPVRVESVTLNKSSLSLAAGATETLTATVYPVNATNKNVTWGSSDETKATVDQNGLVTAVAEGSATITVTTEDGGKTAECAVTVTAPAPTTHVFSVGSGTTVEFAPGNLYYNGADDSHKMNSNLPSGWNFYGHQWDCYPSGTSSVTASNEISLFTWGYGSWSTDYSTNTYQTGGGVTMTDWGSVAIGSDPANKWRTLTDDEWKNLLGINGTSPRDNAENLRAWVTLNNGVSGLVILPDGSTVNPSSVATTDKVASSGAVFLPAAGCRNVTSVLDFGSFGLYWSSSPRGSDQAYALLFGADEVQTEYKSRRAGYSVRLVR